MKTASSDEELAFKQKERDMAMYTRKVQHPVDADLNACDFKPTAGYLVLFAIISANSAHLKSSSFCTSKSMAMETRALDLQLP